MGVWTLDTNSYLFWGFSFSWWPTSHVKYALFYFLFMIFVILRILFDWMLFLSTLIYLLFLALLFILISVLLFFFEISLHLIFVCLILDVILCITSRILGLLIMFLRGLYICILHHPQKRLSWFLFDWAFRLYL